MSARPAFASVRDWCRLSGMGQKETHDAIKRGDLSAAKPGRKKLLVDVDAGLKWLRDLAQANQQSGAK